LLQAAQARAAELQREFDEARARRARAESNRRSEVAEHAARLALLHREIEGRRRLNGETYAWVKRQEAGNNVHSLVSFTGVDPTRWSVDDKAYDFQPLYRYLFIAQDTGQLGWARVGRTRITYVARGMRLSETLRIPHSRNFTTKHVGFYTVYAITLHAEPTVKVSGVNLRIRLSLLEGLEACEVAAWYAPGTLSILNVAPLNEDRLPEEYRLELLAWLEKNADAFA
jgi:hypothetical protein